MPAMKIQGILFEIEDRYAEGHTVTANEANSLNQTRRENIRNNFAVRVKEKLGDSNTITEDEQGELQAALSEYAASYEFGARPVGRARTPVDPVLKEAHSLAREAITAKIKAEGGKVKDYDKAKIEAAIEKLVESDPAYMKQAKQIVKARTVAASDALEGLDLGGPVAEAAE